jgi:hypothetical protein
LQNGKNSDFRAEIGGAVNSAEYRKSQIQRSTSAFLNGQRATKLFCLHIPTKLAGGEGSRRSTLLERTDMPLVSTKGSAATARRNSLVTQ